MCISIMSSGRGFNATGSAGGLKSLLPAIIIQVKQVSITNLSRII